jgi:hypothetical protein
LNFEVEKSYNLDLPLSKIFNKKLDENLTVEMLLQKDGEAKAYSHFLRKISYDHIPNLHYFYQDNIRVITDSIQVKAKKLGMLLGQAIKCQKLYCQWVLKWCICKKKISRYKIYTSTMLL